jgi:hypothetical protein
MKEVRNVCKILFGKPEGKRPFRRPNRRWEYNIKMNIREIGFGVLIGFIWLRIGSGGWFL